jgi:hypothetical protein
VRLRRAQDQQRGGIVEHRVQPPVEEHIPGAGLALHDHGARIPPAGGLARREHAIHGDRREPERGHQDAGQGGTGRPPERRLRGIRLARHHRGHHPLDRELM